MTELMHVTSKDATDYSRDFSKRLGFNGINDGDIANLMMCGELEGKLESFFAPVLVKDFDRRMGSTGLTVCFLDQDLRPVDDTIAGEVKRDVWFPDGSYPFISPDRAAAIALKQGYFLPHAGEFHDDAAADIEELYQAMEFDRKPIPMSWMTRNKYQE